MSRKSPTESATIAENRKARHEYFIEETYEAGLSLQGWEVKSLRAGKVSLEEAWAKVEDGEAFLIGAHIDEYEHGNRQNHEPARRRKLLLHRRQIKKLHTQATLRGLIEAPR